MASCPNCGFDLNSEGKCSVCGFDPLRRKEAESVGSRVRQAGLVDSILSKSEASGGITADSTTETDTPNDRTARLRLARVPLVLGAAVFIVLLAVGVYFVLARPRPGAAGSTAARARIQSTFTSPASPAAAPSSRTASRSGRSTRSAQLDRSASSAAAVSGVRISRVGFSAPVGASPVDIRATRPVNLYIPPRQPLYSLNRRTDLPPLSSESAYVKWMLAHTHQQEKYLRERWERASKAVERHLVVHRRVLLAFLMTPREWFVRSYNLTKTYENTALPIGYGQTISGPDLVAHMTDALDPQPNQRVLEIGTGSGYQSAVLSQLTNYVYTIEIVRPLAEQTNQIYLEHTKAMPEYANIHRRLADGYYGWPAYAPFDRIIVTTGIDHIPPDLLKELKPGGIIVIPIGPPTGQTILKITKTVGKDGRIHLVRENLYPGVKDIFVPFTASGGGTHDSGRYR